MTATKLRAGLIGLGAVGAVHLEASNGAQRVRIVAGADIDRTRAAALAARHGFRPYDDHRQMIAGEALDLVCIATPASLHLPIARDCAERGMPVLCEKPLSITPEDAAALVDCFAAADVPLFYGSCYRFLPAVAAARDLIAAGAIGEVRLIREDHVGGAGPASQKPYPPVHYPLGGPGGTGMGLVDHGIHLLDVVPWLAGRAVVSAIGRGNRAGADLAVEYALLELDGGAIACLIYDDGTWPDRLPHEGMFSWGSGWDDKGYQPPGRWADAPGCISVHGTAGALRIHHYAHALFLIDGNGVRQVPLSDAPAPAHFARQADSFAASLISGTGPEIPGEAGIAALEVLAAIYRSAASGRFEPVRPVAQPLAMAT